ncbi:lactonase family protein [Granulicella tundricola]|uniref:Lipoprotein n=1 Tax=Granulicella tundricola (strain ATCC BAA-1859 / DSM 23138 / MP5ACTX9) TaxID=1198114 RepID=E8X3L1_GRATM|nr:beta-propeller fold lactonase family protein [Granulicella tundricola]ADW68202.1 hypothetical protein AciX9_1139 [Granulicella tundricola MP5ACTX9]
MSKRVLARVMAAAGVSAVALLSGCSGFFVPETTTTTGSTGTSSGDYVYIVNQTSDTLSGLVVGTSTLTGATGSPYGLTQGLTPSSVAVTRANTFVYVGGAGAIEFFSIGTGGALTLQNSAAASAAANFVSMDTSPDGQWLLALDSITDSLYVFGINSTTGALTLTAQASYSLAANANAAVPKMVRLSPNGAYVFLALGAAGDVILPFVTSNGSLGTTEQALALPSGFSDNAVAIDANSAFVYFARGGTNAGTSGVASYSLGTGGLLTAVQTLAVSGDAPYSILLDATGTYAYTANRGDGTVSGFSIASGTLKALTGSPYKSGTLATALVEDNSKKYVIAGAFGASPDLTMYSFDTTTAGQLDSAGTFASGTDPAGVFALAATH